jgi:peptidoglycan/xylan/chitin deacetylase (PgdA/CDA1 family)
MRAMPNALMHRRIQRSRPWELLQSLRAVIFLSAARLTTARVGVVLVYHRIADVEGDPARELVPAVAKARFKRQLRHIVRFYRPVPAAAIQRAAAARRRGERFPIAVTFDDDLRSHVEVAAPMLLRSGVPATFFLCGASLDGPSSFWWERLQRVADAGRLGELRRELVARDVSQLPAPAGHIHDVAVAVEAMPQAARDAVAEALRALEPTEPEGGLNAEAVATLVEGGFAIAFHTRRHDRLPELDDVALDRALTEGRSALERLAGAAITAIAYPHGRADGRVAQAAREAGFVVGFTGEHGPVTPGSDPLLLNRFEPPPHAGHAQFALMLVRMLRSAG